MLTIKGDNYYYASEICSQHNLDRKRFGRAKDAGLIVPDWTEHNQTLFLESKVDGIVETFNTVTNDGINEAYANRQKREKCCDMTLFNGKYNALYNQYKRAVLRRVKFMCYKQTDFVKGERARLKQVIATLKLQMRAYEVWDGNSVTVRAK